MICFLRCLIFRFFILFFSFVCFLIFPTGKRIVYFIINSFYRPGYLIICISKQELMYLGNIGCQCICNFCTSHSRKHFGISYIWKSKCFTYSIFLKIFRIIQNFSKRKIGCNLWKNTVSNLIDRRQVHLLQLLHDIQKDDSLTHCTLRVSTICITDSRIRNRLYSIQMIATSDFRLNLLITFSGYFRSLHTIIIHVDYFCISQLQIHSSHRINYID